MLYVIICKGLSVLTICFKPLDKNEFAVISPLVFLLKTFKQKKKNIPEGTMRYDLHKRANASLQSGIDVKQVVKLPPEEDLNDWIAVHGE